MYSSVFFGGLIIPKWLINDSWSIAIRFGFFVTTKMWPNMDPRSLYLSPKVFKEYKKAWEHFCKNNISGNLLFCKFWKVYVPNCLICGILFLLNYKMETEQWNFEIRFRIWQLDNLEFWRLEICNFENRKFGNWNFEIWHLQMGAMAIWNLKT